MCLLLKYHYLFFTSFFENKPLMKMALLMLVVRRLRVGVLLELRVRRLKKEHGVRVQLRIRRLKIVHIVRLELRIRRLKIVHVV